jgi:hypothetical protein
MNQIKGLKRDTIDKFYTSTDVVIACFEDIKKHITLDSDCLIIEPSAGSGAFIEPIKSIGCDYAFFDIMPEHPDVVEQDFLKYDHKSDIAKVHIIGNPPFGRQSSLAIKFIKHCCKFASSISFILPKSFKNASMQKHFDEMFHCIYETDIKSNGLLLNNEAYDVPCVFQIWVKKEIPRPKPIQYTPNKYTFVKQNDNPDISFRRVGVNASDVSTDTSNKSPQSHYFIKFDDNEDLELIIGKIKKYHLSLQTIQLVPSPFQNRS